MARVTAIVLAAGRSVRMGRQKLLMPWGDSTVIEHVLEAITSATVAGTVVVTGEHSPEVGEKARAFGANVAVNPDVDAGMLSSVRVGLREADAEAAGFLVALGDMPAISTDIVNRLIDVHGKGAKIAVPLVHGKRGHPLIFDGQYRDEVLTQFDDEGLRGLLRVHEDKVVEVPLDELGAVVDIDTPDEYERARDELGG